MFSDDDTSQADGTDESQVDETTDASQVEGTDDKKETGKGKGSGKSYDESYVAKLRQEAAAARIAKTNAEKERDTLKASLLTDEEKRANRIKELEALDATWQAERRSLLTENAIALACAKPSVEAQDPEVLALLVKGSPDLVYDETTGKPTAASIQSVIDALKAEKAYLFGRKIGSAGSGNGASSSGGGINPGRKPPITRAAVEAMSREERQARQPEIDQWLMATGGAEN